MLFSHPILCSLMMIFSLRVPKHLISNTWRHPELLYLEFLEETVVTNVIQSRTALVWSNGIPSQAEQMEGKIQKHSGVENPTQKLKSSFPHRREDMALPFSVSILSENSIKNNAPPSPQRRTLKKVEAST